MTSFFTKASEKKTETLHWRVVHESLLVAHYKGRDRDHEGKRRRVAAFDFVRSRPSPYLLALTGKDSTLITTSSGNVFGKDANDWRWLDARVPAKLRSLYEEG